jgi:uncharacterized membrane protein YbhN (UPF0104 family)
VPNRYTIAKILVAVVLLTWLVRSGRLDFHLLVSAPFTPLHLLGLLLLLASLLVQSLRWWYLLGAQGIDLSWPRTISLFWIGIFFSLVLPGLSGGLMARGYYITREAPSAKVAGISTVLLDRAMGLYALLWLSMVSLFFLFWSEESLTVPILHVGALSMLLMVGTSLFFAALWARPTRYLALHLIPSRFRHTVEATLSTYHARGGRLLGCFGLSLAAGIMAMSAFLVAGQVIGTPLNWRQAFLVCPLVYVIGTLPISPGGFGVGETAASVLFARFGVETGATIMLLMRLWLLLLQLPGGLFYVFRSRR